MEIINISDDEDTTTVVPVVMAGATVINNLPAIFKGDSVVADASWDSILNKPTTFPPSMHSHSIDQITDLQTTLDNKQPLTTFKTVNSQSIIGTGDIVITVGSIAWDSVTDKPVAFPPSLHNHSIDQITDLQTTLDNKQPLTNFKTVNSQSIIGTGDIVISVGSIAWADVTDKPVVFTPTTHNHPISEITDLQTTLDSKLDSTAVSTVAQTVTDKTSIGEMRVALGLGTFATLNSVPNDHTTNAQLADMPANTIKGNNTSATGDPLDLTTGQVKTMLGMTISDISGLQTTLDNKQPLTTFKTVNGEVITGTGDILVSGGATQISWDDVTDKPVEFTPSNHNHQISEITDLQNTLDNKQPLTTFKTVNGQVITGSGDILVSGGTSAGASQTFPELAGKVAGIAIPYNQLSAGGAAWFADLGVRGVNIVRLDAYWDQIQTTLGGAYNWTALDTVVDGLRANGVHVLLVPNNKPAWGSSALTDTTDRQACADFCGALASHFIGRCDNFEIVNEPNKTAISAVTYADLLKRAYVAIKKANPLATVISGGLAPTVTNGANMTRLPEWVDAFFDVPNIGAYFDQFGMHPYTFPYWLSDPEVANSTVENGWSWMVNLIRPRMVAEGLASKPIAITEMGFVSDSDMAFDGAQGQADAVQEAIDASLALPWVSSFFLYSYRDFGGATTEPENWFGMIDPAGADKPLAAVFQTAANGGYAGALSLNIGANGSSVTVRTYTVLADAEAAQIAYPNDIIVLKDA